MKSKWLLGIAACVVIVVFVLGVTGVFSFAEKSREAQEVQGDDKLIGVLLTTEHLKTGEKLGQLMLNDVWTEGDVPRENDSEDMLASRFEDEITQEAYRIYAKRVVVDGMDEYQFEGIDGYLWCVPTFVGEDGAPRISIQADVIFDCEDIHFTTTDNGFDISAKLMVCTSPDETELEFYYNPVHQTSDGDVYAVADEGDWINGSKYEGVTETKTLEHMVSTTVTKDGESYTTEDSTKIEVLRTYRKPNEKIIVTQMSEDNEVLSSEEYVPGKLPEKIITESGASYLVVKTIFRDDKSNEISERLLVTVDEEELKTWYCEEGIHLVHITELVWK